MNYTFSRLPYPLDTESRPIVDFALEALPGVSLIGLVDSGSDLTYIDSRFAAEIGIELSELQTTRARLGGREHDSRRAQVTLILSARYKWTTEVAFVDGWPYGHHILGIRGFFDNFRVTIDGREESLQVKAVNFPQVLTLRARA